MNGSDDELFKTEGPITSVKVEVGEDGDSIPIQAASDAIASEPSLAELPDIFSTDGSPELTAALSDLGLIAGSGEGATNDDSRRFDKLLEQRIAKVRSATADISQQLTLISPPQQAEADTPEQL